MTYSTVRTREPEVMNSRPTYTVCTDRLYDACVCTSVVYGFSLLDLQSVATHFLKMLSHYIEDTCYPLCVVVEESRRFSWMINWLNERGPLGQVFANLVVALFVLPPLGPIVCSFLENCDTTRSSARSLIYHLVDSSEYHR